MSERSQAMEQHAVRDGPPAYRVNAPQVTQDEVPPGYKRTEVGVIPEDWDLRPLNEIFKFSNGINADKSAYGHGIPFINVLEPITYSHIQTSDIPGKVKISRTLMKLYSIEYGDIVFNRTSETQEELGLAAVFVGTESVVFGGFVIRARPTKTILDPIYAGYGLRAQAVRSQIVAKGQGAVRANIGQESLRGVLAPIPLSHEQRAIATTLSDADALIDSLDRLIAKKRAIKQAAMQQLLTGQTRLPGFTGKWETKWLGEILTVRHGRNQADVVCEGGEYPILATGGEIGRTDTPLYTGPSVLIGRKGTIDQPRYMDGPFWTVDTLFYTMISDGNDAKFIYYRFLMIPWREFNEASGVPSLSSKTIEGISIKVPDHKEQIAIATVLSDMDTEIETLERRRDKARQIKQGMMQQLLTGKIRLV